MKVRGICNICHKNKVRAKGKSRDGSRRWDHDCFSCHIKKYPRNKDYIHRMKKNIRIRKMNSKGLICEKCGFVGEDRCQIDIDHIDGNHKNNDKNNLQKLCANCHRLKTKLSKEGIYG